MATSNDSRTHSERWRVLIAISAGNALEWFDFIIYGYFAVTIANHFFPAGYKAASLLLSLGTFGVAFVMRPFGAIIIGNYADRFGRKRALTLTISLMMFGTAIIAFTPTYSAIGPAAPVLIVCARILQGFSAGGEFGSATAYLAEQDPKRRGFFASWQFASQAMTAVIATGFGAILSSALSGEQLDAWGWRLPFYFGLCIGPVAFYIRRQIDESVEFHSAQISSSPFREVLSHAKKNLLVAIGAVVVFTVATYTLIFMPTFAVRQLGLPLSVGFKVGLVTSVLQMVLVPIVGTLSDRWGRLPISYAATIAMLLAIYPLFSNLIAVPTLGNLLLSHICIGGLIACYAGALPAMMSELFPARIRTTGISISYSLGVTIFGGFAPFINASLIQLSGSKLIPCYYLMIAAAITLIALGGARRLGIK